MKPGMMERALGRKHLKRMARKGLTLAPPTLKTPLVYRVMREPLPCSPNYPEQAVTGLELVLLDGVWTGNMDDRLPPSVDDDLNLA